MYYFNFMPPLRLGVEGARMGVKNVPDRIFWGQNWRQFVGLVQWDGLGVRSPNFVSVYFG